MPLSLVEFQNLCINGDSLQQKGSSKQIASELIEFYAADPKTVPVLISEINKQLGTSQGRHKGFELLNRILKYCPTELVEENAVNWSNFAVEFPNNEAETSIRFIVLAQIITICNANNCQDFNRHMSSGLYKKIKEKCLSIETLSPLTLPILNILNLCMRIYPGSCGIYQLQLEKFLLHFLDQSPPKDVLEEVGTCLHYLQQVGPAGSNGSNHVLNWFNQVKKVCATIHGLYDVMFEQYVEYDSFKPVDSEPYKLEHVESSDSVAAVALNASRLNGFVILLAEMLRNSYPQEKQIPAMIILDVIQRGLSISNSRDKDHVIDAVLSVSIANIKLELVFAMKCFIAIMKHNTKIFAVEICQIFMYNMRNIETSNCPITNHKFQVVFYELYAYWMSSVKSNMSLLLQEKSIKHLMQFINPPKINVVLQSGTTKSSKSQKGRKRTINQQIIDSGNLRFIQETKSVKEAREEVCISALQCATVLFKSINLRLSKKTCKDMFKQLMTILNDLNSGKVTSPYDNKDCQVKLYDLLLSTYDQPHLATHIPISEALFHFQAAKSRLPCELLEPYTKALNIMGKVCQPFVSSLYVETNRVDSNEMVYNNHIALITDSVETDFNNPTNMVTLELEGTNQEDSVNDLVVEETPTKSSSPTKSLIPAKSVTPTKSVTATMQLNESSSNGFVNSEPLSAEAMKSIKSSIPVKDTPIAEQIDMSDNNIGSEENCSVRDFNESCLIAAQALTEMNQCTGFNGTILIDAHTPLEINQCAGLIDAHALLELNRCAGFNGLGLMDAHAPSESNKSAAVEVEFIFEDVDMLGRTVEVDNKDKEMELDQNQVIEQDVDQDGNEVSAFVDVAIFESIE